MEENEADFKNLYPSVYAHLLQFKDDLAKRNKEETGIRYEWYCLQRYGANYYHEFEKPILVWKDIGEHFAFAITKARTTCVNTVYFIASELKNLQYFQAILLSKLFDWYIRQISAKTGTGDMRLTTQNLEKLYIPKITIENQNIAEKITQLSKELSQNSQELLTVQKNFLQELQLEKIPQKLHNFDALDFDAFIKEYAKALKIKFADKLEERNFKQQWQRLFETDKQSVIKLKTQIQTANTAINQMVYQLYNLTDEEIKIVEQA
ncbi:MAG: hypothetical protein J6T41_00340, partial [Neisseriaceae bacterium]|nr:hypothetical protein [Neisseriaceae bacterium]